MPNRTGESDGTDMCLVSWNGEEEFECENWSSTDHGTFQVKQTDVLVVPLLAATKCALWTTSLDSKPLMDFVGSLKNTVHMT